MAGGTGRWSGPAEGLLLPPETIRDGRQKLEMEALAARYRPHRPAVCSPSGPQTEQRCEEEVPGSLIGGLRTFCTNKEQLVSLNTLKTSQTGIEGAVTLPPSGQDQSSTI